MSEQLMNVATHCKLLKTNTVGNRGCSLQTTMQGKTKKFPDTVIRYSNKSKIKKYYYGQCWLCMGCSLSMTGTSTSKNLCRVSSNRSRALILLRLCASSFAGYSKIRFCHAISRLRNRSPDIQWCSALTESLLVLAVIWYDTILWYLLI